MKNDIEFGNLNQISPTNQENMIEAKRHSNMQLCQYKKPAFNFNANRFGLSSPTVVPCTNSH